jgi:putative membrane protein
MMQILAYILIALVALEHFYIMYMEMFAWETLGKKTFKGSMPDEMFSKTKTMAYNQGAYNGFLAAGLTWTFFIQNEEWSKNIAIFFLICVIVAGIVGAVSVSKRIFYTQSVPALIALAGVLFFL